MSILENNSEIWVFYMDNVSFHKSKVPGPLFKRLRIFCAAHYKSFLNPIEKFLDFKALLQEESRGKLSKYEF